MSRRAASIALSILLACASGCGSGAPFDFTPISGKITYEDGSPIPAPGLRLYFYPQNVPPVGDAYAPQAVAVVEADGSFASATTRKFGDGVVPGKQKVALFFATDAKGKLLGPKPYPSGATTPLELTVDKSSNNPLELKVPRPK
jgi:hypothetical protein